MNYLAHAYLSFGHAGILAGNMVSDFVKGKAQFSFSDEVQKGIRLHRLIDEFTDTHAVTARAKEIFRPAYRLYSGAIVDVLYDHFLAADPALFHEGQLKIFTETNYRQLEAYRSELPPRFLNMLARMSGDNWLYHYRDFEGIRKSLGGLVYRATYLTESDTAYHLFREHYVALEACYQAFFPDVKQFAKQALETLMA